MKACTPRKCLAAGLFAHTAATDKSGVIEDETWTPAMSPIRVVGDISVYSLTIQPGVEVLFTGNFEFDCPGVIQAAGNAANKIWFHGDTGITWKGLNFLNSAPGSVLDHCIVENSNDHGIAVTNSSPVVSNCEIKNNSAVATGGGLYVVINSTGIPIPSFINCAIINNSAVTGGGGAHIILDIAGSLSVSGSPDFKTKINNNTVTSSGGGGILVQTGTENSIVRFIDCEITDNVASRTNNGLGGGGAAFQGMGRSEMLRCVISRNQAILYDNSNSYGWVACGGGIYLQDGGLSLRNCDLQSNTVNAPGTRAAYSQTLGGALAAYSGNISLFNSCIRENSAWGGTPNGGGIYLGSGTHHVENCTVVSNTPEGIYNGVSGMTVRNSILFLNNFNGAQITGAGTISISHSNVQNGYAGTGNINLSPLFRADGTVPSPWPWPYRLSGTSPCKDAGDPDPAYNDLVFYDATTTPWGSLGTVSIDPLRANVKMFAGVIVQAAVGSTVRIEYSNDLSSGSWTTLSQFAMPTSPYTYYDAESPNYPKRFYRAVEVP